MAQSASCHGLAVRALCTALVAGSVALGPTVSAAAADRPPADHGSFAPSIQHRLNSVIHVVTQTFKIPGIAVWVTVPGEGSWKAAYGKANLATGRPFSLADHVGIGSVTKTFTGTVILQLVQQEKLSLSAPISRWVPQVQEAKAITVRMLLNMTSGIYDEGAPGSQLSKLAAQHPNRPISPQQIVALAVAHGPAGPPGTYEYSDTNYVILGMIAQAVAHQSIGRLITDRVLRPLHLNQTSYPTTSALPSPAATPYVVLPKKTVPLPIANPSYLSSAGAMISTVPDLARWARDLGTGALLSKATFAERRRLGSFIGNFVPLPGTATGALPGYYGLGLFSLGGLIGHNGVNNGFTDDVFYLPARRATIVVAVNGNNASVSGETVSDGATVSIADIVLAGSLTTAPAGS